MSRPPPIPQRPAPSGKLAQNKQTQPKENLLFQQGMALHQQGQLERAKSIYEQILARQPGHFDALHLLGVAAIQSNNPALAVELIGRAIKINSSNAHAHSNIGSAFQALNRLEEAVASFDRAISIKPDYAEAYYNRSNALQSLNRLEEAVASYDKAISFKSDYAEAYANRGVALQTLNRMEEAIASYDKAISFKSDHPEAYFNRGIALQALNRLEEAVVSYDKAITLKRDHTDTYFNRGIALQALNRLEEAIISYDKAISLKPDHAEAYFNRGVAQQGLRHMEEAVASYAKAINIKPDYTDAYCNRGAALQALRRLEEAIDCYDKAISIKEDYAEVYCNRGAALQALRRMEEAVTSYDKAISLKSDHAEAYFNRGVALQELNRLEEALSSYIQASLLKPDHDYLAGALLHTKMLLCDWKNIEPEIDALIEKISKNKKASPCFPLLAATDLLSIQRKAAEIWLDDKHPFNPLPAPIGKSPGKEKIRVGYYSADFREHPVAYLTAEFFENHDKEKFELIAFYYGPITSDQMHKRMTLAFDRFIDIKNTSDQDVAKISREIGIDIAVDLTGMTKHTRAGIFSYRAAPVQVNFLGYAGTMAASYYDYIIADGTVIPERNRVHFSEKVIYLPGSFMPRDTTGKPSGEIFTREQFQLPANGVVYCAFNASYKILPNTFDSWMQILKEVSGSVLWLSECHVTAKNNLRQEAEIRGVSPDQIIFAKRLTRAEDHLARHKLADLFLDTFPYNAHTTANDALWAGLPVITRTGESFASRVAASLLNCMEMPELIASTQSQYEAIAIELGTKPEKIKALKEKLEHNKLKSSLFDTQHFTRCIEASFTQILERHQAGLPPNHIYIDSQLS